LLEKTKLKTRPIVVFSVLSLLILMIISTDSQIATVDAEVKPRDGYEWLGPYTVGAEARSHGYRTHYLPEYQAACASPQSVYPTGSSYTWYAASWNPTTHKLKVHIYNPNPFAIEVTYKIQAWGN
jgi:hypothetical protein